MKNSLRGSLAIDEIKNIIQKHGDAAPKVLCDCGFCISMASARRIIHQIKQQKKQCRYRIDIHQEFDAADDVEARRYAENFLRETVLKEMGESAVEYRLRHIQDNKPPRNIVLFLTHQDKEMDDQTKGNNDE
jgi:hypothetical protein